MACPDWGKPFSVSGYLQRLAKSRTPRCPREFRYFKLVNDGDMLDDYRVGILPITHGPNDGCTSMASA